MHISSRRRFAWVVSALLVLAAQWTAMGLAQPGVDEGPQPTPAPAEEDPQPTPAAPRDDEDPQPTPAAPREEEPPADEGASPPAQEAPPEVSPEDDSSTDSEAPGSDHAPAPEHTVNEQMPADEESTAEIPADEEPAEPSSGAAENASENSTSSPAKPRALGKAQARKPRRLADSMARPTPVRPIGPRASERPATDIDAATLKGVTPGQTTRDELHAAWGPAKRVEKMTGGFRETYEVQPFDRVRVTIMGKVVHTLAIYLAKPVPLAAIAERLEVTNFQPVDIYNDNAELAGRAYPERGVMLGFVPNSDPPKVFQVVAEPVDAEMFIARAEQRMSRHYAACMADLSQALEMSPESPRVQLLHAELALRGGDLDQAHHSAETLVKKYPDDAEFRLTWAKVLAAAGDYPQAIRQLRDLIDGGQVPGLALARAHCQLGDCLSRGEKRDYEEAIKHHQQAIKLAEPETLQARFTARRAAKELMVDAHLAVARDIGWGRWQQKPKAVVKWVEHARAYADDLATNEQGSPDVRLRVGEGALNALAGIAQPPDATKWIEQVKHDGKQLYSRADDEAYRAHLAWRIGVALADATEIEAARRRPEQALELGQLALHYCDLGGEAARHLPLHDQQRGRLLFRLGSTLAVHKANHKQAVEWFDRAVPLLESPVPEPAIDHARLGEMFVSMGVSYWEVASRPESLRLTSQGVKYLEQAVYQGRLDRSALAIPYGNLASMHEQLGDAQEAKRYSELASRHERAAAQ
jgi:tetratricopeptide (TPR) repeat protein